MSRFITISLIFAVLLLSFAQTASAEGQIENLEAFDTPNDAGRSLTITWPRQKGETETTEYKIEVAPDEKGVFEESITLNAKAGWQSDYPAIFGHPDKETQKHAYKITLAPPPEHIIGELKQENKDDLLKFERRLKDIKETIGEYGGAYDEYVNKIHELEAKLKALRDVEGEKDTEALVAMTKQIEQLRRDNSRINQLYEKRKSIETQMAHLQKWHAPKLYRLEVGHEYVVRVTRLDNGVESARTMAKAVPQGDWVNTRRLNNFLIAFIVALLIVFYTIRARQNPENIFVRRIAGLEAVDEAIGRATEMGKPIFFVHGLANLSTISTVAAINILGKIAEKVAEYGTEFKVTNRDPVVLAVSQETVKESYLRAGRPDLYNEDNVFYVSQDQFSYATGVEGMFLREKPASNFFFGYYYAEALLLTETGAHIGAIQIAGTDSYTQLPFFITTCDYTLMGEELYAASAYLSRSPKLLASLKAQDLTKGLIIVVALLGVILSTFGIDIVVHLTESF